jgi:hypothetical protein
MCGNEKQTDYSNPVADAFAAGDSYTPRAGRAAGTAYAESHRHTSVTYGSCLAC